MDNNNLNPNPIAPTPVANTPVQPVTPKPAPSVISQSPASENSSKLILWFVIGLVVIMVVVGGIYLFLSRQAAQTAQRATPQPVAQVTPKSEETIDALDKDLQSVNVENTNNDFSTVDQDLQNL